LDIVFVETETETVVVVDEPFLLGTMTNERMLLLRGQDRTQHNEKHDMALHL
jgi:hypothetical protein